MNHGFLIKRSDNQGKYNRQFSFLEFDYLDIIDWIQYYLAFLLISQWDTIAVA